VHHVALYGVDFTLPAMHPVLRSVLAFTISLVIAMTLYRFVERPCARLRKRLGAA